MAPTHRTRPRAAAALLACAALLASSCSPAPNDDTAPPAIPSLASYGLAGLDAPQVIEKLDTTAVSARPNDLLATVQPTELIVRTAAQSLTLPMPHDKFYLSVAPFITDTHPCHFHSLTTCRGELANTPVHITVTDPAGNTLIDQARTTYDNGFLGLWLPRNITANLTIDSGNTTGTAEISTGANDLTCLTTVKLT
ncbi:CueP family metal-binding protein [Dietzia maris]